MRKVLLPAIFVLTFASTAFSKNHSAAFTTTITELPFQLDPQQNPQQDPQQDQETPYYPSSYGDNEYYPPYGGSYGGASGKIGEVIGAAQGIVAFGESVYKLIQKGKPSTNTKYAPINVVPKEAVVQGVLDPMDLEGYSAPVRKKYMVVIKNGYNITVARVELLVHFLAKQSYQGKGQYIQNAVIIPLKVDAFYGFDLSTTMAVTGVAMRGSRANPIATATITMNYRLRSVMGDINQTKVFDIDGLGNIQLTQ